MSRRARDSQWTKFYDAFNDVGDIGDQLSYDGAVKQFVDSVTATRWWKNKCPEIKTLRIKFHENASIERPEPNLKGVAELRLRRPPTTQGEVLARICQALTPPESAWHGPEFTRVFAQAVARFCSPEEAERLRVAYKEHGVKSRVVSDAARYAARERWMARQVDPTNHRKAKAEAESWLEELKSL